MKAQSIVDSARSLPGSERKAFVEAACAGKPRLRTQVFQLLTAIQDESTREANQTLVPAPHFPDKAAERAFQGTKRFAVKRLLGSGAFGSVYEIWDRELKVSVAAKVLHKHQASTLLRFKQEFRQAVEFHHENLVRLYELFSESEHWFFTMELLEGSHFLEHIRPEGAACLVDRLRPALVQLVRGVRALHESNRLHRDLKPRNVLIEVNSRVVLLDFGLLIDMDRACDPSMTFAGTPVYMSPEQANRLPLTQASDWYAVGVMLHEALTGRLPPSIPPAKGTPHPSSLAGAPPDLADLCQRMLQHDPAARPSGEEIEDILKVRSSLSSLPIRVSSGSTFVSVKESFVGREKQLSALEAAFDEVQEEGLRVVLVGGLSGIGKSATIQEFIRRQKARRRDLVFLAGRCHEFESVPYKGLDELVDQLSRYLRQLPDAHVEALLPREACLLPELFPVMSSVAAIARAPVRIETIPDEQERRQRTFAALAELLGRLSDRRSVIIWVDDLQWSDRDSCTFFADLSTSTRCPPLLLVLSYRSEDAETNSTLLYFHQFLQNQQAPVKWRMIALSELEAHESQAFVDEIWKALPPLVSEVRDSILKEGGGHPLFLQELTHRAKTRADFVLGEDTSDLRLGTILKQRVADLPYCAREALNFICIASQPLSPAVLVKAAPESLGGARGDVLNLLLYEKLARVSGSGDRLLEPYHDQIRSAVTDILSGDTRRDLHARLAAAYATESPIEHQVLVTHHKAAGNLAATYESALKAAALAEQQLAFDRASRFYQIALETAPAPDRQADLYLKLGGTLGKAGRGHDAACAYLESATRNPERSFELKALAAHQLMRSGHIDAALALVDELAAKCHIAPIKSRRNALIRIVLGRIRTRLLFARGIRKIRSKAPSLEERRRLDLLRIGAVELRIADPLQSDCYQVEYVEEALRNGDAIHMSGALAVEAGIKASQGDAEKALGLLKAAEDLAIASGSMNAVGTTYLARVYLDYQLGRLEEGIAHAEEAVTFLRSHCTGVTWELTTAYTLLFGFQGWTGKIKGMRESLAQLFKEGAARGDINVEVSLRLLSLNHYAYLSADEPAECLSDSRKSLDQWSNKSFHLQHLGALYTVVETYLYLGDYHAAHEELLSNWDALSRSLIMRWANLRTMSWFLRGRVLLACWLEEPTNARLSREIERCSRRLERIQFPWAHPMNQVLQAGLALGRGNRTQALKDLKTASEGFKDVGIFGYASTCRYLAGRLLADQEGQHLVDEAMSFWKSQEVRNHQAFMKMLLPGLVNVLAEAK